MNFMKKYSVVTGFVHTICRPYHTNSYYKAFIAMLYRKIRFGRGWILTHDSKYYKNETK